MMGKCVAETTPAKTNSATRIAEQLVGIGTLDIGFQ